MHCWMLNVMSCHGCRSVVERPVVAVRCMFGVPICLHWTDHDCCLMSEAGMSLRVTSLPAGCLMMDFASMVWCCSPVDGVLCFVVVCNCAVTPDAVNYCFDWCFH